MPLLLLAIGILFVATGLNNTTGNLFGLLGKEFSGSDNKPSFIPWLVSLLIIGSLGYIDKIKPLANMFLVLVMTVLVIVNKGVFQQFTSAFKLSQGGVGIVPSNDPGASIFNDFSSIVNGSGSSASNSMFTGSDLLGKVTTTVNRGISIANGIQGAQGQLNTFIGDLNNAFKGTSNTSGSDYGS